MQWFKYEKSQVYKDKKIISEQIIFFDVTKKIEVMIITTKLEIFKCLFQNLKWLLKSQIVSHVKHIKMVLSKKYDFSLTKLTMYSEFNLVSDSIPKWFWKVRLLK